MRRDIETWTKNRHKVFVKHKRLMEDLTSDEVKCLNI